MGTGDNTAQTDATAAFLRAVRSGNLEKVIEYLDGNLDIDTSNSNGLNALHLASKDGHVEIVTELLKRGAKVDAATKKGNTALHIASLAGQSEIVTILIEYGAAVNIQSQNGFTPLYMAAQENHDQVVKILLSNGANQSLATEDGFTPLAVAMQQGHDKVVSVLLENDSKGKVRLPALHIAAKKDDCKAATLLLQNDHKPDVTSKSGFTPLHIAAHYGNEDIARLLIKKGADVNYLAKHNISPLHVAAKWGKNNMVKILLEHGAVIDAKTRDGLTPLHCAARSGHDDCVTTLLENSAPISARTKNGLAPLHMASQGDHVYAARVLLYHRAPVDEVTIDYLTSLHVAAHCGHVRVAKLLIDRKADPNARALNGFTPLHIACKKNRIKVVELLLKHGASIESTTESGLTPLHVASFMGCMNIVIFLLQHEASPDVTTVRGETPLHLAARAQQTDIIRILLRNGAKVDARAREQQTPLHIASRLGNVDIVMLLLQHGAVVDSTTKDMYTALHIAAKEGQEEVAAILVDNNASVKAATKNGFTPLHIAAKYGNVNVTKILLQKDSKLDEQGKNDITPLLLACHYDHPNVAQLLLDKGASPHLASQNGQTPLHIAARKNQMDIASTLLEHGAKANVESKAGFTPLHLSAQRGHYDMTNLLIEHGADPNHKAKNGLTALHLCAQEDFIRVASILVKNGADVESETETGYRPIHVAAHFGNLSMVRFLLKHGAKPDVATKQNYTPLHQAAQQGHAHIVSALIEDNDSHRARTNDGLTALNIAQKLGYISVMEVLKGLPYDGLTPDNKNWEEKYKVIAPESLQETSLMSDSEDEGVSDALISEQPYRYLTADLMKSLRDDSLPIDVTKDDPIHSAVSTEDRAQFLQSNNYCAAENFDSNDFARFLVSFLVDARGGTMKGCRHSGIRLIVPPRRATMPIRVTCRLVKPSKMPNPPPLMEGESLATRVIEMGPVGATFLGPVLIDIPHFASIQGLEREIIILRSENGETWKEHDNAADNDDTLLKTSFDPHMSTSHAGRITRIITTEFPQYFAIVTRIKQEVRAIGAEGGTLVSTVAPQVQAVFPPGALTKKIKVGLQAHVIPPELTAKLLGNCVAVSPVITVEPRRRKFHKPISLTLPVPQAANKGMINNYGGETPTLRLLCSIAGGTSEAQWEDVTGSTPLVFTNDKVSFTTTVSARFWLMDCRNVQEVPKMASDLYRESLYVPFITNFVIYSKRMEEIEATLRILCMTDSKEGIHTLEKQEEFAEIVKSRDVETLDGKDLYIEFTGNLVPVTKSGQQLRFTFKAFRQNRLSFHVKVKDPQLDPVARMMFMREPKVAKGELAQQPLCVLNIVLPEVMIKQSYKGMEDSNIVSQKLDLLKSSYRMDYNQEKYDKPKRHSPTERKVIDDTLQKETDPTGSLLLHKSSAGFDDIEGILQETSSPALEKKTYSEKRRFWEDIASSKRESLQRSESEISHASQLTYHDSDSEGLSEVRERSDGELELPGVDMSECSVAEKAHYFEEQIQKESTAAKSSIMSQSSFESSKISTARLSGISISSEDDKSFEIFEESGGITDDNRKSDPKCREEKKDEEKDVKTVESTNKQSSVGKAEDNASKAKIDEKKINRAGESKDASISKDTAKLAKEDVQEKTRNQLDSSSEKRESRISDLRRSSKDDKDEDQKKSSKKVSCKSDQRPSESTPKGKMESDLHSKERVTKKTLDSKPDSKQSQKMEKTDAKTKVVAGKEADKESKLKATKMQENVTKQLKAVESRTAPNRDKVDSNAKSIPVRQKSKEEPFSKSPPKKDKTKDDVLSKSPPKKEKPVSDSAKLEKNKGGSSSSSTPIPTKDGKSSIFGKSPPKKDTSQDKSKKITLAKGERRESQSAKISDEDVSTEAKQTTSDSKEGSKASLSEEPEMDKSFSDKASEKIDGSSSGQNSQEEGPKPSRLYGIVDPQAISSKTKEPISVTDQDGAYSLKKSEIVTEEVGSGKPTSSPASSVGQKNMSTETIVPIETVNLSCHESVQRTTKLDQKLELDAHTSKEKYTVSLSERDMSHTSADAGLTESENTVSVGSKIASEASDRNHDTREPVMSPGKELDLQQSKDVIGRVPSKAPEQDKITDDLFSLSSGSETFLKQSIAKESKCDVNIDSNQLTKSTIESHGSVKEEARLREPRDSDKLPVGKEGNDIKIPSNLKQEEKIHQISSALSEGTKSREKSSQEPTDQEHKAESSTSAKWKNEESRGKLSEATPQERVPEAECNIETSSNDKPTCVSGLTDTTAMLLESKSDIAREDTDPSKIKRSIGILETTLTSLSETQKSKEDGVNLVNEKEALTCLSPKPLGGPESVGATSTGQLINEDSKKQSPPKEDSPKIHFSPDFARISAIRLSGVSLSSEDEKSLEDFEEIERIVEEKTRLEMELDAKLGKPLASQKDSTVTPSMQSKGGAKKKELLESRNISDTTGKRETVAKSQSIDGTNKFPLAISKKEKSKDEIPKSMIPRREKSKEDFTSTTSAKGEVKSTKPKREKSQGEIPKSMIPKREKSKDEFTAESGTVVRGSSDKPSTTTSEKSKEEIDVEPTQLKREISQGEIPKSMIPKRERSKDEFTLKKIVTAEKSQSMFMTTEKEESKFHIEEKTVESRRESSFEEIPKSMIPKREKSRDEFSLKSVTKAEEANDASTTIRSEKSKGEIPKSLIPRREKSKEEFLTKPADKLELSDPSHTLPQREKSLGEIPKSMIPRREKSRDEFPVKPPQERERFSEEVSKALIPQREKSKDEFPIKSPPSREKTSEEIPKSMIPRRERSRDEFSIKSPAMRERSMDEIPRSMLPSRRKSKDEFPLQSSFPTEGSVGEIPRSMIPRREKSKDEISLKSPPSRGKTPDDIPKSMIPRREKSRDEFSIKLPPSRERSSEEIPRSMIPRREKSKDEISLKSSPSRGRTPDEVPKSMIPRREKSRDEFSIKSPPSRERSSEEIPRSMIPRRERSRDEFSIQSPPKREKSMDEPSKTHSTGMEKSGEASSVEKTIQDVSSLTLEREKSSGEIPKSLIPVRTKSKDEFTIKSPPSSDTSLESMSIKREKSSSEFSKSMIPRREKSKEEFSVGPLSKKRGSRDDTPLTPELNREKSKSEIRRASISKKDKNGGDTLSKTGLTRNKSRDEITTKTLVKKEKSKDEITTKVTAKKVESKDQATRSTHKRTESVIEPPSKADVKKDSPLSKNVVKGRDTKPSTSKISDSSLKYNLKTDPSKAELSKTSVGKRRDSKEELSKSSLKSGSSSRDSDSRSSSIKSDSPSPRASIKSLKKSDSLKKQSDSVSAVKKDGKTNVATQKKVEHLESGTRESDKVITSLGGNSSNALDLRDMSALKGADSVIPHQVVESKIEKSAVTTKELEESESFQTSDKGETTLISTTVVKAEQEITAASELDDKSMSDDHKKQREDLEKDEICSKDKKGPLSDSFATVEQVGPATRKEDRSPRTQSLTESSEQSMIININDPSVSNEDSSHHDHSSQIKSERDTTTSPCSITEQVEMEEMDDKVLQRQKISAANIREALSSLDSTISGSTTSAAADFIPDFSGARVLEILEPDGSESRQDSMDVPSIETDDYKVQTELHAIDGGRFVSQHGSSVYSIETTRSDSVSISGETTMDLSLSRDSSMKQNKDSQHLTKTVKGKDSFEIDSPPLVSPKSKIKELEIKPVNWMIGDEKIEVSEPLEPSQAFDKELEEYQKLLYEQGNLERKETSGTLTNFEIPRIEEILAASSEESSNIQANVKSKFTVVPVSEQDLEVDTDLVEKKLEVSCQELIDTLQREYDARTPTDDRLEEIAAGSFQFSSVTHETKNFDLNRGTDGTVEPPGTYATQDTEFLKSSNIPLETKTAINVIEGDQFTSLDESQKSSGVTVVTKDDDLLRLYEEKSEEAGESLEPTLVTPKVPKTASNETLIESYAETQSVLNSQMEMKTKQSYDLENYEEPPEPSEMQLKLDSKNSQPSESQDDVQLLSYKPVDPEKLRKEETRVGSESHRIHRTHRDSKIDFKSKSWDDHKRSAEKREKSHGSHSETSPFKTKRESSQSVDMSSRYAITVLDQVVKKEIAEVKENLEAAKQDLIEELSENRENMIQIEDSPSEFQFKLQAESIPNELPFLYKEPSLEKVSDTENLSTASSPVAKPRRNDETPSKGGTAEQKHPDRETSEMPVDLRSEGSQSSEAKTADVLLTKPKAASRSGSVEAEILGKDENFTLQPPQPAPRRRQKGNQGTSESEAEFSSSESNYQSCEYGTGSRPCSSDVEALLSGTQISSSEYETAKISFGHSSSKATSQDYLTAASTLSSKDSMKSLDHSISSGQMCSLDSASEISETLMASEAEMEQDAIDENLECILDDDTKVVQHTQANDDSETFESESGIPRKMKRSSEMIFSEVITPEPGSEGKDINVKRSSSPTSLVGKHTSSSASDSSDFKTAESMSSDGAKAAASLGAIPKRINESLDEKSHSSSEQIDSKAETYSFEPDSLETKYAPPGMSDDNLGENSAGNSGLTLQQQLSMTSSSMSGVSLETVIEKEHTDRHSPDSDSFELVDKPDLIDDFVVVEEVGKEAEEFDSEGKGIRISSIAYTSSKNFDRDVENLITEKGSSDKLQAQTSQNTTELFEFDSEESPRQSSNEEQYSQSYSDDEQYTDGSKKWIEMQFQQNEARLYEMEYERGPLEDIKEEEVADFEAGSSRIGSLGSQKESIGSLGSIRGSFGSTPDNYDALTAKRYFKPTDHDNVSLSSLQEFEHLESAIASENAKKREREQQHSSSQDSSSNGSLPRRYTASHSGHGDDLSVSSVKDFEVVEKACREAHLIELRAREEEDLLDHESPENRYKLESLARAKAENQGSPAAGSFNLSTSGSDDYEKRIKEVDEIIKLAQASAEKIEKRREITVEVSQITSTEVKFVPVTVVASSSSITIDQEIPEPSEITAAPGGASTGVNLMQTSTDSLELEENGAKNYNLMCRSSDSLELKTAMHVHPSLSSDSLNNVRDSKDEQDKQSDYSRRISSDSLELSNQELQDATKRESKPDSSTSEG